MNNPRLYPCYLLVLGALLYLPGLGGRDFWAPVEPRYAEIARVMFAQGEWIVPTVNGALYTDKPILYFWLVLIFSKLAGAVNEWTVRLPAALGGLGTVLATYKLGKDFYGSKTGLVAAAVLATSVRVIWESRWAHVDMMFTFFFTLSMLFVGRAILREDKASAIIPACGLMALAVLTKGLIGVVLPALVLSAYVAVRRDWRLLRRTRLLPGAAIFLLIAAPWFILVAQATAGRWLSDFIYIHHIQRYTAGAGHRQPVYYYWTTLPLDFLPWSIFVVPALFAYGHWKKLADDSTILFFALWFLAVNVFFTLSDTKRELYLLPLFPPLALLVARYVDGLVEEKLPHTRLHQFLVLLFSAVFGIISFSLPIAAWLFRRDAVAAVAPFALATGLGSLSMLYFARRRSPTGLLVSTILTMMLGVFAASHSFLPFLNRFKSPRAFALAVKNKVPASAPLYIYADTMHDFNFYMEREAIPVISKGFNPQNLAAADQPVYLLIKERDVERVRLTRAETLLASEATSGKSWSLVVIGGRRP